MNFNNQASKVVVIIIIYSQKIKKNTHIRIDVCVYEDVYTRDKYVQLDVVDIGNATHHKKSWIRSTWKL